ncbi:MAG: hypothetical protein ACHQ1H_14460, partial [Nitrososphaerales archaeon]
HMFNDLFHLIQSLEHDYKGAGENRVHLHSCRRCAITVRLNAFKLQILKVLRDIDFGITDTAFLIDGEMESVILETSSRPRHLDDAVSGSWELSHSS